MIRAHVSGLGIDEEAWVGDRHLVSDVDLVQMGDGEELLKLHAAARRHSDRSDAITVPVQLDQEISLRKKGARAGPRVIGVLEKSPSFPLLDAVLRV